MSFQTLKGLIPFYIRANMGRTLRNLRRKPNESPGIDFVSEITSRLPRLEIKVIFDVGAHVGLTALEFSDRFPKAAIFVFEPSLRNFKSLQQTLVGKPEIKAFRIGLSSEAKTAKLLLDPDHPSMARLSHADGGESVELDTLDHFCAEQGLSQIDILKIDTEGHEIEVLQGAKGLLQRHGVKIIKAEVAVDPDSSYHTPFSALCDLLHPLGYRLFGFYDQSEDQLSPGPRLRRFDAAFIACAPASQSKN